MPAFAHPGVHHHPQILPPESVIFLLLWPPKSTPICIYKLHFHLKITSGFKRPTWLIRHNIFVKAHMITTYSGTPTESLFERAVDVNIKTEENIKWR
jgi:hypothetical protein